MDTALLDLLRSCSNDDNKEITHSTSYGPARNWSLNDNTYENFWKVYCDLSRCPERNNKKLCLSEVPRKHMPIIADLTLKFHPMEINGKDIDDPYDEDFILSIVYCYQQVIKETLKISEAGVELICCVLRAKTVLENNLIVCRLRLQFPYCKTINQIQNRLIRPLVLQMIRTTNVVARLPSQPVNEWEDIVDPLSVEKPVIMYGSSISPNVPKYVLEYILHHVLLSDIDKLTLRTMELEDTFFPQNHEQVAGGILQLDMFKEDDDVIDLERWLPYFLSIYYVKEITLPKNINMPPPSMTGNHKNNSGFGNKSINNYVCNDEDKDSAEYLSTVFLGMLDQKRAEEEHYWLDVGRSLHHAFKGEERGLEKWIDFSDMSDVFTDEDCKSKWYGFNDNKITIRTLAFYAREDNLNEYKRWHEIWCMSSLEKATSCTHSDVAEAIYRLYWLEFACSNLSKNTMYNFRNHIWRKLDSGSTLKSIISGDFLTILEKFRVDVAMQISDSNDKNFKDSAEIMIQKICKLILKLKNRPFKNSIYSECTEKFYIENFEQILDTNPNLMGCTNGLIETLDTKAVFRDGKPEDYVSKTTGVYYRKDMNERHPSYLKLLAWFQKVFVDKELNLHFGKMMGALLKGRNSDKIFPIQTGSGNNSKSMVKKLVEAAFGDYCITFQLSTFTGARSGGPDPSVARSRYAHIAFIQEPDSDTPLKGGVLKEFTGGDRFFARFLHDNGELGELTPMFTLCLQCNNVPNIPSDKALKNRVKIVPFLSEFSSVAPKDVDSQFKERKFPLDAFFENTIPDLAPAFLYYCIKHYAIYRREGLIDPPIVRKYTGDYWEEHDFYSQFIKENIEKAYKIVPKDFQGETPIDETSHISLAELYGRFKDWFKENYQLKLPDRAIFKNEMENRVTKCVQRNFYGIKFKVEVANI
jgi:phage/plasmid-associated DNA primase